MKLFFKILFFIITVIVTVGEAKSSTVITILPEETLAENLSPLTPVIVSTTSNLPLVAMALDAKDPVKEDVYIVPAIFLKYIGDKELNEEILKTTTIALDVTTIALSGGVALATKLHWVRRAWAIMEVVGAAGNIAVNLDGINVPPALRKTIDIYNVTMGLIGLKNIGESTVQASRKLFSPRISDALNKNLSVRQVFVEKYVEWLRRANKLEDLTEDQIKLLVAQNGDASAR